MLASSLSSGTQLIIGVVVTLWLASLGAVWKVASILSSITAELRDLRAETVAAKDEAAKARRMSEVNGENIGQIQRRLNVPQSQSIGTAGGR